MEEYDGNLELLKKYEYRIYTHIEMAKVMEFREKEIRLLEVFIRYIWFGGWIFLDREFIREYLCNENNNDNAISLYYSRILETNGIKDVDYKILDKEEAIKIYSDIAQHIRGGHNAKYYTVTKDLFKILCILNGGDARKCIQKIETLEREMISLENELKLYTAYRSKVPQTNPEVSASSSSNDTKREKNIDPEENIAPISSTSCELMIVTNKEYDGNIALLEKYGYREPTNIEMAKMMNFNEKEINLMDMFWDPAYNNSRILLEREFIRDYFCGGNMDKSAINNFCIQVLEANGKRGKDYEIISCKEADNYRSLKLKTNKKGGQNAKFYIVSGEFFKKLGMIKNDDIREYFIKVEILARELGKLSTELKSYKLYLSNRKKDEKMLEMDSKLQLSELSIQNALAEAELNREKAKELKELNDRMNNSILTFHIKPLTQYIYAMASNSGLLVNSIKVGGSDSIDNLHARLLSYSTGRDTKNVDEIMHLRYIKATFDYRIVENYIAKVLAECRVENPATCRLTEMYKISWEELFPLLDKLIDGINIGVDYFNTEIIPNHDKILKSKPKSLPPILTAPAKIIPDQPLTCPICITICTNKTVLTRHINSNCMYPKKKAP